MLKLWKNFWVTHACAKSYSDFSTISVFLQQLRGSKFLTALGIDGAPLSLTSLEIEETEKDIVCCDEKGSSSDPEKPQSTYFSSPNWSSRNGKKIDHIIIHYTVSRTMESVISQFRKSRGKRVSAHYIIGRDGRLVQMVRDTRKAWHANRKNGRSIGIEHVAMPGDEITPEQEKTLIVEKSYSDFSTISVF